MILQQVILLIEIDIHLIKIDNKIMLPLKLKIAQLLYPKSSYMGFRACFFKM